MTSDEARERFVDAADDGLSPEDARAFEAALAADDALRAEYDAFRGAAGALRAHGQREATAASVARPAEGSVSRVQRALRERSGGRFYPDRFSRLQAGQQRLLTGLSVLTAAVALGLWAYLLWLR